MLVPMDKTRDKTRVVSATEFKAKCLSFLDEIEQQGTGITVTRRGHPVAVLGPAPKNAWKSPANSWAKKAIIIGDIVDPGSSDAWEVLK
jgi:prevent-host-death family protein